MGTLLGKNPPLGSDFLFLLPSQYLRLFPSHALAHVGNQKALVSTAPAKGHEEL